MTVNENSKPLLTVKGLKQYFKVSNNYTVHAVENVSFQIYPGETYGLVGESGSGKSTIGRSIIRLYDPTAGEINFNGMDISGRINKANSQALRTQMQMIFQDPMTALNPVMTVGSQIAESIQLHQNVDAKEAMEKAKEMLRTVGISDSRAGDYPHQFSGGMKQRVIIAIALACQPNLLIADEPTTALDVTIQAQVLSLMKDLIVNNHMSMLLITHDLGVVAETCDDVAVVYAGRIVEVGSADDVFNHTRHPYTEGLFDSLPNLRQRGEELVPIKGLMPDPMNLPRGCTFAERCPYATEACRENIPELRHVEGSHYVACDAYRDSSFRLRRNQNG